jgi:multidrug efflux pump subunit AcrA (membrane-fusion protein)
MWINHRNKLLGASLATVLAIGVVIAAIMAAHSPNHVEPSSGALSAVDPAPDDENAISVKTIRPRRDASFAFMATQPAYVEAYYRAPLEAQLAGRIKSITKDEGSPVKKGELLAEIEVPDLVAEVAQKDAVVKRCRVDQRLAEKQVPIAEAAAEVAMHNIAQKEAEAEEAQYTMEFRQLELNRIQIMVQNNTVYRELLDEKDRAFKSARSAHSAAQLAVKKAQADYKEAKAKVDAAIADVDLKKALVDVAQRDWDKAKALADYAKITAPFDGVITSRKVDPGAFVKNAATAHTEPLLVVERTDIVSVFMRLPDNYAPYVVDNETEARIEMSELPGRWIQAKVSRHPPTLNERDRRMRVEVDLFNGTSEQYQAFLAREKESTYADLKYGPPPFELTVKGRKLKKNRAHFLLPGMVGKMTLVFEKIEAFLVPSSAIFSPAGKPYLYEVKDGTAHLVPIEIQVNNGKLAKVTRIVRVEGEEIKQDLTGEEEIVLSNQGELSEGAAVKTTRVDW